MDFSWTEKYPDLHRVCTLFQMYELINPIRYKYKPLESISQDGPQCGIVALTLFTNNISKETINQLLDEAKRNNFSYNGEMFNTHNLCELANNFTQYNAKVYEGKLHSEFIKNFLFDGGCMLVPYDCDKNHAPCSRSGHGAHWTAVSGIIETDQDVYVIAKHGKSRNIAIWKLNDLSESNAQLNEFSPPEKHAHLSYRLPVGGIAGPNGLCNKSILLK